jgi:imidazolonepropionase-like amidohydrolase
MNYHYTRTFIFLCISLISSQISAQQTFPVPAPSDPREACYALTNATIYTDYKTRVEGATLVIRKGMVEACGIKVVVPKDAVTIDCSGKNIYPGFIDIYAGGFGLPEAKAEGKSPDRKPQMLSNKKGIYSWNEALKSEFDAASNYTFDEKAAEEYRKIGFSALNTFKSDGIARGTGALISLLDGKEHESILMKNSANYLSFRKGTSTQDYPSSLMGCIALLRQTYLDGKWYTSIGNKTEQNLSLEAWNRNLSLPQIFESSDKLDVLRIARIGQEFGAKYLIKTSGDEYMRIDDVKASGQSLIVPLNFPEGYDVRDPFDARNISLKDLKHWESAPSNPAQLEAAGIAFALTTAGLKDKSKFMEQLRKAIEYGLTEETALKALTFQPAQFLNAYASIGSLEKGKVANFILTNGNIFKADTKIYQTWSKGKVFIFKDLKDILPSSAFGEYNLSTEGDMMRRLVISGKPDAPEANIIKSDSSKIKVNFSYDNGLVTLSFAPDTTVKGNIALSGNLNGTIMSGVGTTLEGRWLNWTATWKKATLEDKPTKIAPMVRPEYGATIYPFMAFGKAEKPKSSKFLLKNATVWTNEKEGILQNADVLVSDGKITQIGKNLPPTKDVTIIDATGKHLTAGIIDEHSHIALSRGTNEGTQESSAEVRIGDVIDSEDIDIYRQLGGGVTSSHILHGSANPIGGQTQLIKLRWGATPEAMKFQNWPGFIKFALGENVKQSNWGDENTIRYPQTRMGVEQTFVDYFTRAQEYSRSKKSGKPYRSDLDLEALLEILESKRFITCHSYVQSEITMLIRVAERFGFKVNTFTHILEGYKVADKMAKHGAGGSTFSDWWAYKYEVWQAIPQNAKIMADQGVVVAINSDDAEMARRLNQEAAKSVMYGGMKEEDAWKMVTLNPAKLLRVADKVGSIKVGKEADLVVWSDNPLSIYAKAEKTWIDGIKYFDREEDAKMQLDLQKERARLIQKLQANKKGGEGMDKPSPPKHYYGCDDAHDEG